MLTKNTCIRFGAIVVSLLIFGMLAACSDDDVKDILPSANVRVIHLSPGAPAVDVDFKSNEVDDTIAALAYESASPYTEVTSATSEVVVRAAGTDTVVLTIDNPAFSIVNDNTVYVVNLPASIEVIRSEDDPSTDGANARVRFIHASPDAPAVDIVNSAGGAVVFSNASFKTITDYIDVPPGNYTFTVNGTGTATVVATLNPVTLDANTNYTVVAYGTFLDDSGATPDAFPFSVRAFVDTPGDGDASVVLLP